MKYRTVALQMDIQSVRNTLKAKSSPIQPWSFQIEQAIVEVKMNTDKQLITEDSTERTP